MSCESKSLPTGRSRGLEISKGFDDGDVNVQQTHSEHSKDAWTACTKTVRNLPCWVREKRCELEAKSPGAVEQIFHAIESRGATANIFNFNAVIRDVL